MDSQRNVAAGSCRSRTGAGHMRLLRAGGIAAFVGFAPLVAFAQTQGSSGGPAPPSPGAAPTSPAPTGATPGLAGSPAPNAPRDTRDEDVGHRGQVNLRVDFLTGYRMLFRYDSSPRCAPFNPQKTAEDQQKFCGYGAAPALGIALGFSLVDIFEPFVFARLGLANEAAETNRGKMVQIGGGARIYAMSNSPFKFFFAPWLGIDLTSGPLEPIGSGAPGTPGNDDGRANVKPGSYKTDLLAHFDFGPQYDFSKHFGMYLSGGMTFQMVRYAGASAELAFGIQGRAP